MNLWCETPLPKDVSVTGNVMNIVCPNVTLMYSSSGRDQEKHHCSFNNSVLGIHGLPPFKTQSWPKLFKGGQI